MSVQTIDDASLEAITREFCKARGVDPDARQLVPCPDGLVGCCVAHYGPAWHNHVDTVLNGLALIQALAFADGAMEK